MSKTKRSTDRYVKLHAQGLTNIEIARKCGVSPSAVTRYFQDNGITRNGIRPGSKHEKALRRAEKRKLSYRQAAKEMGLSQPYVSAICRRLGIKLVDGRGAGNNRGKGSARVLPKVKDLEWGRVGGEGNRSWTAESICGLYVIRFDNRFPEEAAWMLFCGDGEWTGYPSMDAAKAAAQEHYASRILSALQL